MTQNIESAFADESPLRPESDLSKDAVLGDYRLVREIGRGGMGVVYEARQISLDRRVALKVLPFTSLLNPLQLARFENEARAAAGLHHENIVPVYGIGCDRGTHFYAMQYVDGQDLAAILRSSRSEVDLENLNASAGTTRIQSRGASSKPLGTGTVETPKPATEPIIDDGATRRENRLTSQVSQVTGTKPSSAVRAIAEMGQQAALALEYAHSRGVIHRDVKPSNLMVDRTGKLWLTDFGLAQMESTAGLTMSGDLLGTLRYMSPEQAVGRRGVVDQRSDVYSLGATLYELLTIREMFPEKDRAVLLRQIAESDPVAPKTLNSGIPDDLETIILKATAKEPVDRYATAGEMADDLQRFLDQKPILAKRQSTVDRLWKWSRRHREMTLLTLSFVVLLTVLASVTAVVLSLQNSRLAQTISELDRAERGRSDAFERAKQSSAEARKNELVARDTLYALAMRQAYEAKQRNDPYQATQLLQDAVQDFTDAEARGVEWTLLHRQLTHAQSVLPLSQKAIYTAVLSPSGETLAVAGEAGTIWLISTQTGEIVRSISTEQIEVNGLTFSPDESLMASSGDDGTLKIWSLQTFEPTRTIKTGGGKAFKLEFVDGAAKLISTSEDSIIRLWDAQTGSLIDRFKQHQSQITAFAISPDQKLVLSADHNKQILVWEVDGLNVIRHFISEGDRATTATFSPDGSAIITGHLSGWVRYWGVAYSAQGEIGKCFDRVLSIAFHPDCSAMMTTDKNGAVRNWPYRSPTISGEAAVAVATLHRRWDFDADKRVDWCGLSPDGRTAAVLHRRRLHFRDLASGTTTTMPLREETLLGEYARQTAKQICAFSPDGRYFAVLNDLYRRSDQDEITWEWKGQIETQAKRVFGLAIAPDSNTLVNARMGGQVGFFQLEDGRRIGDYLTRLDPKHRPGSLSDVAAVSRDGRLAAISCYDDDIDIFDIKEHRHVVSLPSRKGGRVLDLDFAPDGETLISCQRVAKEPRFWNLQSGEISGIIPLHAENSSGSIESAAYSPDQRWLATGNSGPAGNIRIWDLQQSREVWSRREPADLIRFSSDGKSLFTSDFHTGRQRTWRLGGGLGQQGSNETASPDVSRALRDMTPTDSWMAHQGRCWTGVFDRAGNTYFTVGSDGVLKRWDRTQNRVDQLLAPGQSGKHHGDRDVAVARRGGLVVVAGTPKLRVYRYTGRKYEVAVSRTDDSIRCVDFSDNGRQILTGHHDGRVSRWDAGTLELLGGHQVDSGNEIHELVVSPGGSNYAVRLADGEERVRVLSTAANKRLRDLRIDNATSLQFSPDGRLLMFGSRNDVVVYNLTDNSPPVRMGKHRNTVNSVCINPLGTMLASASDDRSIILWHVASRAPIRTLVGHESSVNCVSFSPDGRSLISSDDQGRVKVWHVSTGRYMGDLFSGQQEKFIFTSHPEQLVCLPANGHPVVRNLTSAP